METLARWNFISLGIGIHASCVEKHVSLEMKLFRFWSVSLKCTKTLTHSHKAHPKPHYVRICDVTWVGGKWYAVRLENVKRNQCLGAINSTQIRVVFCLHFYHTREAVHSIRVFICRTRAREYLKKKQTKRMSSTKFCWQSSKFYRYEIILHTKSKTNHTCSLGHCRCVWECVSWRINGTEAQLKLNRYQVTIVCVSVSLRAVKINERF